MINIKKELQNSLVRAEKHAVEIRETTEYNSDIIAAEKDILDCWLRLVAYAIKEEHGIHIEPIVDMLVKAGE